VARRKKRAHESGQQEFVPNRHAMIMLSSGVYVLRLKRGGNAQISGAIVTRQKLGRLPAREKEGARPGREGEKYAGGASVHHSGEKLAGQKNGKIREMKGKRCS